MEDLKNKIIIKEDNKYEIKTIIEDTEANKRVLENVKNIGEIVKNTLKSGTDYGTIPLAKKPFLWMSGAEKLSIMLGLSPSYEIIEKVINLQNAKTNSEIFIMYLIKCNLSKINNNGERIVINEGFGAANNREKAKINSDQGSLVNNLLKIAKKRSFVDAIKSIAAISDVFTQDEDTITNNNEAVDKHTKMKVYRAIYTSLKIDLSKEAQKNKALEFIKKHFNNWIMESKNTQTSPMDEFNKEQFNSWLEYIKKVSNEYVYSSRKGKIIKRGDND